MNHFLREILDDVLEIQEDKLKRLHDEYVNAQDVVRITGEAYEGQLHKVNAIKAALAEKDASTD